MDLLTGGQLLVNGILIGLIYGLSASGLTLIWGVLNLTNFAHGQFLMIGMYLTYWASVLLGADPLTSLPLSATILFVMGGLTYRLLIQPIMHAPPIIRILVTFGLGIVLANAAQFLWSADYRTISPILFAGNWTLAGIRINQPRLIAALGSLVCSAGLYTFLRKSQTGRALQAVSMDRDGAAAVGINVNRMFTLAFAIGVSLAGIAGNFISSFTYIYPGVGSVYIVIAFTSVTIGGFGSVPGAMLGGLLIGLTEAFGGFLFGPVWKYALVYLMFFVVIIYRPKGLLGW